MKRIFLAKSQDSKICHYLNSDRKLIVCIYDSVQQLLITYWQICWHVSQGKSAHRREEVHNQYYQPAPHS